MQKRFRSIFKLAIGLGALTATGAASAIPIQYDWVGTTSNDVWNAMGYVVIDDSQYGLTLDANNDLTDWMFSWTDGNVTHVNSFGNEDVFFSPRATLTTNAQGDISDYTLCTFTCQTTAHPFIFLQFDGYWTASTGGRPLLTDFGLQPTMVQGSFSTGAPQSVPEPTSAALLGAGVIAFGALRRKKRKLT